MPKLADYTIHEVDGNRHGIALFDFEEGEEESFPTGRELIDLIGQIAKVSTTGNSDSIFFYANPNGPGVIATWPV